MKLFYKDLASSPIEKLVINSLEQSLYQALVVIDGEEQLVWHDERKTLTTRSLSAMRELFEAFEVAEVVLRHESSYDEMIGLGSADGGTRMEVPLGKSIYPQPE